MSLSMQDDTRADKGRLVLFVLTFLCACVIGLPKIVYHSWLSTGDHGRDLYAAWATLNGDKPYQDYWWVYGPLMPYVYGAAMKYFGVGVRSVLAAQVLLNGLTAAFLTLGLSLVISGFAAFLAGLWWLVFHQGFFYTYNHTGGLLFMMIAWAALMLYLVRGRGHGLSSALTAGFLCCLVKLNFGLLTLLSIALAVLLKRWMLGERLPPQAKISAVQAVFIIPPIVGMIYVFLMKGLLIEEIRQCLPYFKSDHPYNAHPWQTLLLWLNMIRTNIGASWPNFLFSLLLWLSVGATIHHAISRRLPVRLFITLVVFQSLMFILMAHEFWASGVLYRLFWAQPFSVGLMFLFLSTGLAPYHRSLRLLMWGAMFVLLFMRLSGEQTQMAAKMTPQHYLSHPLARVFVDNDPEWIQTVMTATNYLESHLKPNELFFAAPYDPLYYFLVQKRSPTRQLIFFEHIRLTERQQKKIIREIQTKNVSHALLSSRIHSKEPGMGVFGRDHSLFVAQFIEKHYRPIMVIGDWSRPGGWAWNHGVMILKKVPMLNENQSPQNPLEHKATLQNPFPAFIQHDK